ncbi:FecR domain-containing protein [Marivibrio halodurans]|uniref:FecR domain-containing protein n=1 Tax=Marivibrio halodurans TaxID=2039722 RepID=A0A8J7RZ35_9PROT|nr:FecR domain-containing protein [Marivibrio halodurans]MBP5857210.1 FecR domain-containing protein [Marivibrio halodurans]
MGRPAALAVCAGVLALSGGISGAASDVAAQEAEQAGVSAAVRGEVLLARTSAVGRQVESGDPIFLGDSIEAGPNGNLQVLLMDESVLTLGPGSRIEIDRFIYNPASDEGNMALTLAQGTMRFVAGKVASGDPQDMRINTPVGHIGIRGTIGLIQVLDSEQAGEQFPDQMPRQGGGGPNQPVVFAALAGPGMQSTGVPTGSFTFSSPNGSVDLNRPGGSVLATPGQPPVFFIAPPGAINTLSQQVTGGSTGNQAGPSEGGPQADNESAPTGDGVTTGAVQNTGGSPQPVPTFVTVSEVEQTATRGDQGDSTADASDIASSNATSSASSSDEDGDSDDETTEDMPSDPLPDTDDPAETVATLQEVIAANTGSVGDTGVSITGAITGSLAYYIDFGQRTFDFQASDLNGSGLSGASIGVDGFSAALPNDTRTSLTIGNNGEDFAARVTSCDNCSLSVEFPTTSSFDATVTHDGGSGTTGQTTFLESE